MALWTVQALWAPSLACAPHSVDPLLNVSLSFFTKADNTIQTFGTDMQSKEQTWEVIEHDLGG